ncbi:universal stress protein, partial [Saccharothrix sp. MB29]|nr:universal stress protein [Saccharothrix sp. MB29]
MSDPILLVGVDGSVSALRATRWAAEKADHHRVPLKLVHASSMPACDYPEVVLIDHEARQVLEQLDP